VIVEGLVGALRARDAEGRPTATGSALRHSMAGSCARQVAWAVTGTPPSDPPDEASLWSMALGSAAHEAVGALLASSGVEVVGVEVPCAIDGDVMSGHADLVVRADGVTAVVEVKTMGATGFDVAVGLWRGSGRTQPRLREGAGPKVAHVLQAALCAEALDADEAWVLYLATDPVSRRVADAVGLADAERFARLWRYTRPEWQPLAAWERRRLEAVAADPSSAAAGTVEWADGRPVEAPVAEPGGPDWPCGWCRWRSRCARGETP
jgi:hypothetical protein